MKGTLAFTLPQIHCYAGRPRFSHAADPARRSPTAVPAAVLDVRCIVSQSLVFSAQSFRMKLPLLVLSIVTLVVCGGGVNQKMLACECDAPSCPAGRLDTGSLCACLNNAALFCWYRNNRACASPVLQVCGGKGGTVVPNATATPARTYTPPYQGNGGLNCVEIGYCSRPSKSKTSMTVTISGTESVITVPVGLPTPDLQLTDLLPPPPTGAAQPIQTEAPIVFTPIPEAAPATTPPPRMKREHLLNEGRWLG